MLKLSLRHCLKLLTKYINNIFPLYLTAAAVLVIVVVCENYFFVKQLFTNSPVVFERAHLGVSSRRAKKTARKNLTENYNFYTSLTQALINMFC